MSTRVRLQEAFKLALSITLFYWFTLAMDWAMPKYGVLAIALVAATTAGDSVVKGVVRSVGTVLGAVVGLGLLVLFPQDSIGLMLAVAALLVAVTYIAQTSEQPGVWTMVAIMFILVWFTGYTSIHRSFHFSVFRTLETVCGVLFYTVVSVLLWPITAERKMMAEGRDLWSQLAELGRRLRRRVDDDEGTAELTDIRHQIAGSLMKLDHTLPAVYADTWATVSRKPIWECLRLGLRSLVEALDHWRLIVEDVRALEPGRHLPGLDAALGTLQARFGRCGELWERGDAEGNAQDERLLEPLSFEEGDIEGMTSSEHAALALFIEALGGVDRASREVLRILRTLVELDPPEAFACELEPTPLRRPSVWSRDRLFNSLLPAICWFTGFGLWITFNIPGGPIVALLASVFAIVLTLHPMNLFELLKWLLVSLLFIVTPVYLFVLPRLDSPVALLTVVFVFCFLLGWIGTKKPLLQLTSLGLFGMLIDISNQQTYSVMKIISVAMILILAVSITTLIYQLLRPLHPVSVLKRELRRFFVACARVVEGFNLPDSYEDQGRRLRKAAFEDRILPVPHRLDTLAKQLTVSGLPEGTTDDLEKLVDGAEVLSLRLEALEYTHEQAVVDVSKLGAIMNGASEDLGGRIQRVFERWSETAEDERAELSSIEEELARRLDTMQTVAADGAVSAEELRRFYVLTASIRGLLSTMGAINLAYVPVREFLHESSQ